MHGPRSGPPDESAANGRGTIDPQVPRGIAAAEQRALAGDGDDGAQAERATAGAQRAAMGTPLYVHLPFCAAKCHYCDFFSVPAEGIDRSATLAAIVREAELFAALRPRTVFVGGGTPSLLSVAELTALFDALNRVTGFRESAAEVTAECNPESLDGAKARALLDLGVTRISIGFQSLHDDVLKLFGRVHSVEQSFRAYDAARSAGARNVNVDLIYAVPGQSHETWERDLARVLALEPDHVSAYNLTFEEETVFKRWLEEGRLARQPEDVELALFETTRALTARHGYEAYEVSNFARPSRRCAHNVNYWENGEYVGIGPSAVSKIGHTRSGNVKPIAAYGRRIRETSSARAWSETPTAAARLAETWWLGLRLREGLTAAEARRRSAFDGVRDPISSVTARLVEQGLLDFAGERFSLSARGLPLADYVAKQFLASIGD
jgi:oxygen-independent coproporphyrinogen-3 oxidase